MPNGICFEYHKQGNVLDSPTAGTYINVYHVKETTRSRSVEIPKPENPVNLEAGVSLLSCYQKPLSGINVPLFMQYLQNYNQVKRRFLYLGLTNGFKLHYKGPVSSRFEPNHASVGKDPQLLRDKIASELQKGFTVGPFKSPPFSPFIVSPVGLVPKKEVGKYRMILDLSFPKDGTSVNAFIPREFCTVKYEDFHYICDMVVENGRGCLIANTDIESAFSILPISPFYYWLLGFS